MIWCHTIKVEHRPVQKKVIVPEQQAKVICGCVFPCVPTMTQAPVVRPEEPVGAEEKHETWKVAKGSGRFKCNDCGKWFPQKSNLTSHKRSHIQGNNTNIGAPCPECKKKFKNSEQLEYHTNKEHIGLYKVTESKTPHKKISFSEIHNCPRCE